ncbi:MAG: hypothetical protein AAFW73_25450, partial [Bacteroidota bacterium]
PDRALPHFYSSILEKKVASPRDQVISIDEIQRFAETSATPADQRRLVAFPEAGGHIITSDLQSKDLESVRRETYKFAEEVLKLAVLKPVGESTTTN